MARSYNRDVDDDRIDETWTEDEIGWYLMGPFDGKIPGLVRRVRRILDVSQRGLAAILQVSQSVVARWETGRVSPRASVLHALLRMAGLTVEIHDEDGAEVAPMRDDGARDRRGRRYPAHVDLTVQRMVGAAEGAVDDGRLRPLDPSVTSPENSAGPVPHLSVAADDRATTLRDAR